MKRVYSVILVLAVAIVAMGQDAPLPQIAKYVPPGPDRAHVFVMDSAHVLSPAAIAALQDSALALQSETGSDVAWVTLPTLGGRAIEDATVYLGRAWKIGSAGRPGDPLRNRGLVILYIPDKTKTAGSNFRVEVGKGLQGTIIDSRSRAILAVMRDDLRAKQYDAAFGKGWNVAARMVREDYASQGQVAQPPPIRQTVALQPHTVGPGGAFFVVLVIVGVIVLVVLILVGRARRTGLLPATVVPYPVGNDDDDERRRRDISSTSSSSSWFSSGDSGSSSSSSDSGSSGGGDFGGGGGFDGGGSSDSV